MNILTINTSFNKSYVAVKTSRNEFLAEMDSSLKQSENILGLIDETLKKASINVNNLDAVGCVIGPGSFTGIRIGASMVKGFCFANSNVKKVAINSLNLVAHTFAKTKPNEDFWVVLNALSGNLFACKYSKDGMALTQPTLAYGNFIENINGIVVGLEEERLDICNSYVNLSASTLLNYTEALINCGEFSTDFIPLYIRKSQAEAEQDKKDANS